ncbi:hypothetical protein GGX14DRAFT_566544 [Mycena pura]|uniref:Uncharacterized protein n=1 Tax=Mycena pura TaxID=153505 RepID=A0AAD6VEA8_9AGAR|nr:hypothetical protein GGX14DRAFT_566544 [Mycena pura]
MARRRIAARKANCDLLENDAGLIPCDLVADEVCHGTSSLYDRHHRYSYASARLKGLRGSSAACDACPPAPQSNITWDDYSNGIGCSGLRQQFVCASKDEAFPSWVFSMLSATPEPTTFDLAAASAFVLGPSSIPASPAPPVKPTSPDQPQTTVKTSSTETPIPTTSTTGTTSLGTTTSARSNTSALASLPSAVPFSSQGIAPLSRGPTVPPPTAASVSGGSSVLPTPTSPQQVQLPAHRNSFPVGAVAGIVIGICSMIALVVFYHCWRRRRRQAVYDVFPPPIISPSNVGAWDADTQITKAQRTKYAAHLPSATTASDAPSGTVPEAPLIPNRRHLQTESHHDAAQEKMEHDAEWVSNAHPAGITCITFPYRYHMGSAVGGLLIVLGGVGARTKASRLLKSQQEFYKSFIDVRYCPSNIVTAAAGLAIVRSAVLRTVERSHDAARARRSNPSFAYRTIFEA